MIASNLPTHNATITVVLPPWLASQAAQALQAERIPYDLAPNGAITTLEAAAPIIEMIQARHQPQRQQRPGLDLLSRQPANRSLATDAIGFAGALTVVYGVVSQSARIADPTARGVAILIAGILITLLISELVLRDRRRGLFIVGMIGLFTAAAMWFVLHGMGGQL